MIISEQENRIVRLITSKEDGNRWICIETIVIRDGVVKLNTIRIDFGEFLEMYDKLKVLLKGP